MPDHNAPHQRRLHPAFLLPGLLCLLWTSGCNHNPPSAYEQNGAVMSLPKLTAVTTGPVAQLLTRGPAFASDFAMTFAQPPQAPRKWTGRLFVREGHFRLDAAFVGTKKKIPGADEFSVIWDAPTHQGFVTSETLQGYAPIATSIRFTNQVTRVLTGEPQRLDGHPVEPVEVIVMDDHADRVALQVLRAPDAGGLPLEIRSPADETQSFTLTLSNVKLVLPAADEFLPPDGFSKYENENTLMNVLAERMQSLYGRGAESDNADEMRPAAGPPR